MHLKKQHRRLSMFLLALLAWSIPYFMTDTFRMQRYARAMEKHLQKREQKAHKNLQQIIHAALKKQQLPPAISDPEADYNLVLYLNQKPIYWLNRRILPSLTFPSALHKDSLQFSFPPGEQQHFQWYKNGWFAIKKQQFNTPRGLVQAFLFFPLRDDYDIPSTNRQKAGFYPDRHFPEALSFSATPTDYPIHWSNEQVATWLQAPHPLPPDRLLLHLILFFLLPAIILFLLEINDLATRLSQKQHPWAGVLFLLTSVLGLRALSIHFGWLNHFKTLPLFAHTFETQVVNNSLGDLLINIFLLLWLVLFFQKTFPEKTAAPPGKILRLILAVTYYLIIVSATLLISASLSNLVIQSSISFDFENVFKLETNSLLAIGGAVLLVLILFLFCRRMAASALQLKLSMPLRMLSAGTAILLAYPLYQVSGLNLPLLQTALAMLIAIGLLDFYIDAGRPNLTWLMSWLIVLSGFTSLLLYKFNGQKEVLRIKEYAQTLADPQDHLAKAKLNALQPLLKKQPSLKKLTAFLQETFKQDYYLAAWYDWKLKKVDCTHPSNEWQLDSSRQNQHLHIQTAPSYTNKTTTQNNTPTNDTISRKETYALYVFRRNHRIPTAYQLTGLTTPYRNLEKIDRYDYAVYRKGTITDQSTREYYPPQKETTDIPVGKFTQNQNTNERLEYYYRPDENTLVVIGRNSGGFLKPLSLFSYLFALLFLGVFLLSLLNQYFHFFSQDRYLARLNEASLGNKIQYWMIGLILISFFSIGLLTAWHFQKSADLERERQVRQRINALTKELQNNMTKQEAPDTLQTLQQQIHKLSERHQLDINLFDRNGSLLASSEDGIYRNKLCEPIALYPAVVQLRNSGTGQLQLYPDRLIRHIPFLSIYLNVNKGVFLNIAYYKSRQEVNQSVADFIGTLLNVYVFLLLITSSVALAVTESITRPLKNLRDSLQRMQLGKTNEPIPLEEGPQNELGMLIAEYNQMLSKLEESAKKLAESERESAWREMAKQVAHEIKNPLTPMRLSIQHLEMAYQRDPQKAAEMIGKVTKRLIEQIDTLTGIATAFSRYAKMPPPENEHFELNELLHSVFGLFQKERPDMQFSLRLPDEKLYVYTDRSQLLRVINNLLKNAMQAIPAEREGHISLQLSKQNNKALISIRDNGSGIPEELHDKVFRPNFTTKSSGSGLGLAMSKNIIQTAGGKLWFETQINKGTTFFVELPLAQTENPKNNLS